MVQRHNFAAHYGLDWWTTEDGLCWQDLQLALQHEKKHMKKFEGTKVQCKKCLDIIWSRYSGEWVSCKCGAIYVDQTEHYSRYGGNTNDFSWLDSQDSTDEENKNI